MSGLWPWQLICTVSPGRTVVGFAEQEIVGGWFCFTLNVALQLAVPFLPSVMLEVTVYDPGQALRYRR